MVVLQGVEVTIESQSLPIFKGSRRPHEWASRRLILSRPPWQESQARRVNLKKRPGHCHCPINANLPTVSLARKTLYCTSTSIPPFDLELSPSATRSPGFIIRNIPTALYTLWPFFSRLSASTASVLGSFASQNHGPCQTTAGAAPLQQGRKSPLLSHGHAVRGQDHGRAAW